MRLTEEELARRGARVQQLLRPISRSVAGPAWTRQSLGTSQVIIGTHDEARPTSHYRDWRFTIDARRHHAMYFETWRMEARNRFVLDKAYLNLYERNGPDEIEIVCLHCDPSLPADADHAIYKRGPHVHMSIAGSPYDSIHIALSGPDLTPVLRSVDALHSALTWGIEMIRDEILVLMRS
jgi:hypothetical protein